MGCEDRKLRQGCRADVGAAVMDMYAHLFFLHCVEEPRAPRDLHFPNALVLNSAERENTA